MNQLVRNVGNFIAQDEGVTMIEYGLLAALIAVACVVTITGIGTTLNGLFTRISNCLSGAC
ncbi:MAG TPA: Flp family type IVb pilin [Rhodocyclaceae bacterium]